MNGPRIGFHYHIPAIARDGRIWMPGYLAFFVDSLAESTSSVTCFQHSPLSRELDRCDTALRSEKVELVSLGPHVSVPGRLVRRGLYRRAVLRSLTGVDALLIRGPSPLLPVLGMAGHRAGIPVALLLVGDYVRGSSGLHQPVWKKMIAKALARVNKMGQDKVARRALVFVNNAELREDYESKARRVVETRTTTLRSSDIFPRRDTCSRPRISLLFAGRFERAKGLMEIVEALAILVKNGLDIELRLVGWEEPGEQVLHALSEHAAQLGVGQRISNAGFLRTGPELLQSYRDADIYVIASQMAEGFPRTIWEAMASSTPVVATAVGSIPQILRNGQDALLVEPRNAPAIAKAVESLVSEPALRQRLINNGLELARLNTLEQRANEMVEALGIWAKESK